MAGDDVLSPTRAVVVVAAGEEQPSRASLIDSALEVQLALEHTRWPSASTMAVATTRHGASASSGTPDSVLSLLGCCCSLL